MGRRAKSNPIDWEAIEKEYRLGQSSVRQMGAAFNVQPSAISRRAAREGWVQDKTAAVRALSDAQLLLSNTEKAPRKAAALTTSDIEAAADARTNVVLGHRKQIGKAQALAVKMMAELEAVTARRADLENLAEQLSETTPLAAEALRKVLSMPSRVGSLDRLANVLKTLVTLERQAYNIDSRAEASGTIDEWILAVSRAA